MTPGFKVYERSKFQKFASNIIGSSINFENPGNFFIKCIQRENVYKEIKDGSEAL